MGLDRVEGKYVFGSMGGAWTKTDTIKIASDWQYELTKDILNDEFDVEYWKNKILEFKHEVDAFKLSEEYIVNYKAISKDVSEYGQPTIDSKTGLPKIKKDGSVQHAPIPAHIKLAKKMIDDGVELEIGDKVGYVVTKSKPRIEAISIEEFRKNPSYDVMYYWEKIIVVLIEILQVTHPDEVYTTFKECWGYTDRQTATKDRKNKEYLSSDLS